MSAFFTEEVFDCDNLRPVSEEGDGRTDGHVVVDLKASLVSSTPRTKSDQSGRGSRI